MAKISKAGGPSDVNNPPPVPRETATEVEGEMEQPDIEGGDDASQVPDDPPIEQPPSGSIATVLAWVGDDLDRARLALDTEMASGAPRSSLVSELERRLV